MKVLTIGTAAAKIGTERYGGVERMQAELSKGLVAAGNDVIVAAPKGSVVPEGCLLIETVELPQEMDREDIALASIFGVDFDVVHDFSHQHKIGRTGVDTPAVFMLWDPVIYKYPKSPYNICCATDWQRERFEKTYFPQKAIKDWRWIDTSVYHPSDDRNDRLLYLGALKPEKGPDLAIKVAQEMGVGLDVVGGLVPSEIEGNQYVASLREMADGDKVKIHFNVSEEEKLRFLQTAKAMIYPVRQDEAHCLAMIEAWVVGCPTVVLNKGANMEIMYEKGFVVDDLEQMKAKVLQVGDYQTGWVREHAIRDYSLDNVVPKWMGLYERVIGGMRW